MTCRRSEYKSVKLYFQLRNGSRGANLVGAGVCICSHSVGGLADVSVVLAATFPASEAEDAADAKRRGATAGGDAFKGFALRSCVARAVVAGGRRAGVVGELHHVEDCQGLQYTIIDIDQFFMLWMNFLKLSQLLSYNKSI